MAEQPIAHRRIALAAALVLLFGCSEATPPREEPLSDPTAAAVQERTTQETVSEPRQKAKIPAGKSITPTHLSADHDAVRQGQASPSAAKAAGEAAGILPLPVPLQTESYAPTTENRFISTANDPLSTFSIDVDTASYANVRRFINGGSLPPSAAVRIEEMINYFPYDYPQPDAGPVAIQAEVGPAPWHPGHRLVRIGLQAKDLDQEKTPPSNLVFLVDVSGSMQEANKLPLLQQAMRMFVEQLTARDRLAIVVYAGSEQIALPPTAGDRKTTILHAIDHLAAGGATHASSGIRTAYELAEQGFMPGGNNRVILASDGDFNVGVTDRGELRRLIGEKRRSGICLTVLGFGMGNYHDDTMEILADSGDGNYAYIDSLLEAKKVLIKERVSTLFTLARDVKIQVEFNPVTVGAYRLIGYENRLLADEDFHDDEKDAGEIGLGHRVTALYELIPPDAPDIPRIDMLKYGKRLADDLHSRELMTIKLRYKPEGKTSSVMTELAVRDSATSLPQTSDDFRFAASVAAFGMLLNHSPHLHELGYGELLALARNARGQDENGYRAEFVRLVETAEMLSR